MKGKSMTANRLPDLGDKVRDKITGFEGIVVSYSRHIAGCDRLWIEPKIGADGKRGDGVWIDIDLAEIVEASVVAPIVYTRRAPGGIDLPSPR